MVKKRGPHAQSPIRTDKMGLVRGFSRGNGRSSFFCEE